MAWLLWDSLCEISLRMRVRQICFHRLFSLEKFFCPFLPWLFVLFNPFTRFGMLKKKKKEILFANDKLGPGPARPLRLLQVIHTLNKTREIAKLRTNKGIYFSFLLSFLRFMYSVFRGQNTVYLSAGIQCIYRPEYSVFNGQNTVYLAVRIQCI